MDTRVQIEIEQKFYKDDSCCLKSDPSLSGYIASTPYDLDEQEDLEGLQIFCYTTVPQIFVDSFMTAGVPPEQHYFVIFFNISQGCALVHEDDLQLVDRNFLNGNAVERISDSSISGKIVDASTKCTLEPIVYRPVDAVTGEVLPVRFSERPWETFQNPRAPGAGPGLLYDVPYSELRGHEKFSEGDYIVHGQKLGIIEHIERDVRIRLPDSRVVSPLTPLGLDVPVYGNPDTVISTPELSYHQMFNGENVASTFASDRYPGQSVFTTNSNLNRGDRVPGSEDVAVQAYIVATTAEDIHIHWLCPNVFSNKSQELTPDYEVWRESRLQENASKCDFVPSTKTSTQFEIGDRVRFRDPTSAKMRYAGFQEIPSHDAFGYDLNVFRIVASKTEAIVQWEDGSRSTALITDLKEIDFGQGEFWPGDLVVHKDGVSIVDNSSISAILPQILLEHLKDTLRIEKLGIVQTVNCRERIASVRWYENPSVELLHGGNKLNPMSSFGPLGDTITSVSFYELSTYAGLTRNLDDLVIFAPTSIGQSAMSSKPQFGRLKADGGSDNLRFVSPRAYSYASMYLLWMKELFSRAAWFLDTTTIGPPRHRRYSIQDHKDVSPNDFFGKIVAIDSRNNITVRVPNSGGYRDIEVPFERIMLKLSIPSVFPSLEEASPEDEDAGDDWIIEDDHGGIPGPDFRHAVAALYESTSELAANWILSLMHIGNQQMPDKIGSTANRTPYSASQMSKLFRNLTFSVPALPPSSFAVLEGHPPIDHYYIDRSVLESGSLRTKRIRKDLEVLAASLPPGIFVRSWESRMDLLRAMIIGPEDTPYEYAPFVFDVYLGPNYPVKPPLVFFHSWNAGQGQVNPNLYEDGRICLSVLGTWPTENPEENWSPENSTLLQVFVSLLGLVLVRDPYYNEAGYEVFAARDERRLEASQYTEKAFLDTRKFIMRALEQPVIGFEDVLTWQYLSGPSSSRPRLLRKAIEKAQGMIDHCARFPLQTPQSPQASAFCARISMGASVVLQKLVSTLEKLDTALVASTDS
ncbi:hypothetical protein BDV18DRAFT_130100 [Aspergillus unguis]